MAHKRIQQQSSGGGMTYISGDGIPPGSMSVTTSLRYLWRDVIHRARSVIQTCVILLLFCSAQASSISGAAAASKWWQKNESEEGVCRK